MGRMLGPADYGVLAVLTSIIYIFAVPTASIQTIVSKYTTKFNIANDYGKIKGMLKYLIKEVLIISIILFSLFVVISLFLSKPLDIPFTLLVLTGLFLFGAFLSPIGIGVLQGMKKFKIWGFNTILNSSIKLAFSIILVILGLKVYGAIWGFITGVFISLFFILPYIKEIINSKEVKQKISILSFESLPILISMFIITLMYSLDIIFVKVLFPSDIAGKYSVASMIGKMILFGTSSISGAMFPLSSERFYSENKARTRNVIKKTFWLITIICVISVIVLTIFPELIIKILFGSQYLEISGLMMYIAVSFSLLSLTNTLLLYKISVDEFKFAHVLLLGIFLAAQITGFILFNQSLLVFSIAFLISTIITFIGMLLIMKTIK
jgi:Polysaccharide biosynthesis protein.